MMVGEDISALANSATLNDRDYAYMIWGVDDSTHEIVGTKVRLQLEKKGEQELETGFVIFSPKMQILSFTIQRLMESM